jgi:CubicO group peptidase (beta-lactamase class C family)
VTDPEALFGERAAFVPGSTIAWGVLDGGDAITGSTDVLRDPIHYQIGSVTKLFTGSLLALLVREGVVGLDTRIGELIDIDLAEAVAAITLLELATHTAGLPRLPPAMHAPNVNDPYATFDRDALFGFLAQQQNGAIVDGRGSFAYSNFGASVLGELLSIATGRTFAELLDDEIFVPLGMRDSYVAGIDPAIELPGGSDADGEPVPPWRFDAFAPCGGVVSTARDLLTFARALCEGMSPLCDVLREATVPHSMLRHGPGVGLCWMCEDDLRWHNGQTFGHHAMVAIDLATPRAAIALWNAAVSLDDLCFHLVRPSREVLALPVELQLDREELARYAGSYDKEGFGGSFTIVADARGLVVEDGTLRFRLYPQSAERFFAKQIPGVTFTFELDAAGEAVGIEQTKIGIPVMRAKRVR